nr:MAG: hypothetical protein [Bacteriophage sp.]
MKLKCIKSNNKIFLKNKIYEVKGIKNYNDKNFYIIKDEDNFYTSVILSGLYWKFEIVKENEMKELTLQQAFEYKVGTNFEVIYENGEKTDFTAELYKDCSGIIGFRWKENKQDLVLMKDFATAKFIPIVEKEVSFMEAVKAFSEGKKIKSVFEGAECVYNGNSSCLEDDYGIAISDYEILEGKWYIID